MVGGPSFIPSTPVTAAGVSSCVKETPMHYIYRCTTEQLPTHLDRIRDCGDTVLWPIYLGGRDWVLICQRAAD